EGGEFCEARGGQRRARQKIGLVRGAGKFVPRADREAVVAAIDAVTDQRTQFKGDHPLVLDRQIRNAAPSIELVRRRESPRWADVEAGRAGAAMVALRRVGCKLEGEVDLAEKQPRPEVAGNEVCMFALPTDPCPLRQWLFHYRCGIDKKL